MLRPPPHAARPQAKLGDDGKSVELEVEMEAKEDDRQEKREVEYTVPL